MASKNPVSVSDLSNDQVREQALKVMQQRDVQRERMKSRSKQKRVYNAELLAVAEKKGLLPKDKK
jgi:hypothetical protein